MEVMPCMISICLCVITCGSYNDVIEDAYLFSFFFDPNPLSKPKTKAMYL